MKFLLIVVVLMVVFTVSGLIVVALGGKRDVQASTPALIHKVVSIGHTAYMDGGAVCGSTPEVLDQMENWTTRGDTGEVARILLKTRSVMLDKGMMVKVLEDRGLIVRQDKVRIVGGAALNDPRMGRECWIEAESIEGK